MDEFGKEGDWEEIIGQFYREDKKYSGRDYEVFVRWLVNEEGFHERKTIIEDLWNRDKLGAQEVDSEFTDKVLRSIEAYERRSRRRAFIKRQRKLAVRYVAVLIPLITIIGAGLFFVNKVYKQNRAQYAEYVVPHGLVEQAQLPDGSNMWLNSGSRLKYSDESDELRRVELEGESYFSVKSIVDKPFIVTTEALQIEVLGTAFNVEAYPDRGKTIISLDSGSVGISNSIGGSWKLESNSRLIYDNITNEVEVVTLVSDNDWREGDLIIEELTLQEILTALERKFNLEFNIYINTIDNYTNERYILTFNSDDSPDYIMSILSNLTGRFNYIIKEDLVIDIIPTK